MKAAVRRKQRSLYTVDSQLQDLCVGMHRMGMRIDETKRQEHESRLAEELNKHVHTLDLLLGDDAPNPNSPAQVQ